MLSEADQAAIVIKAMPRKYHPTIQTLITTASVNKQPVSLEELVAHLTESIKLDQSKDKCEEEEATAMAAHFKDWHAKKGKSKSNTDKNKESKDDSDNVKCYNCSGIGHYSRDCSSKKTDRHKKKTVRWKGKAKKSK